MKSTPLLFSPPMIRACLDGRKRMTRRLVNPQPPRGARIAMYSEEGSPTEFVLADRHGDPIDAPTIKCRYGLPGDEIWAKETWRPSISHHCAGDACDCGDVLVRYDADGLEKVFPDSDAMGEWEMPKAAARGNVSPLFMPRWASRFVRTLIRVRIERLQGITEKDAVDEGVEYACAEDLTQCHVTPVMAFAKLWDSINGERAPWSSNPWVWVLEW